MWLFLKLGCYQRTIVHVVPLVVLLASLPLRTDSPTGLSNLATVNFLRNSLVDSVFVFIKRFYLSKQSFKLVKTRDLLIKQKFF